jgi:hypothetical protein
LRSFFYHAKNARGISRVVEKTPKTHKHSSKLRLAFPKAKLLYIYRHPSDVYTSYVRRGQIESGKEWLKLSLDRFCTMHRKDIRLALKQYRKMENSLLLIKYENFTCETEIEFKRICYFLS